MLNPQINLDELLRELELDSSDQNIRAHLESLIKLKPEVVPRDEFISSLRKNILSEIQINQHSESQAAVTASENKSLTNKNLTINYFSILMKNFLMPAVVAAFVLVAGGVWYANQTNPAIFNSGPANQILSGKVTVSELAESSFGDLSKVKIVDQGKGGTTNQTNASQGGNAVMAQTSGTPTLVAADGESDKMAAPGFGGGGDAGIMPYYDAYKFNYVGKDLPGITSEQSVYKRIKPEQSEDFVTRLIRFFSFGLIDLTKFSNSKVQSFSFMEDKEFGYGVNVDLTYGSINMYQNWEKWPQPYACTMTECSQPEPIKPEDYPTDKELFEITDKFLVDYGISREGYGSPRVVDYSNWRIMYEQAQDKSTIFIPDFIQVVYPLILEGREVYDESGYVSGVNLTYDIRNNKVSSLYDLSSKQFAKSGYEGETKDKRLIEIAEKGGFRNYNYFDGAQNIATLQLDTPTIQIVRMWYNLDPKKQGEELFVPALVFPIKNWEKTNYWRRTIMVPLVKSILDTEEQNYPPYPYPMPVDAPVSTEPATSTDSVSTQVVPAL